MHEPSEAQVTQYLHRIEQGDRSAMDELLPRIYEDLRRLARHVFQGQRANHTLQPTALVNEAFLRLAGDGPRAFEGRKHFMNLAAKAMRQLLTDHARRSNSAKRGGDRHRITLDESSQLTEENGTVDLIAIEEALTELDETHPRLARIVELRFLAGLNEDEIAEIVGVGARQIRKDWRVARAWLRRRLAGPEEDPPE